MNSSIDEYRSVRGLPMFSRAVEISFVGLLTPSCSDSYEEDANDNQAGSSVMTDGTAGQSGGTVAEQPISATGGTGGLQADTGGTQVTGGAGSQPATGGNDTNAAAGTGGQQAIGGSDTSDTAGAGGQHATGGTDVNVTAGAGGEPEDAGPPEVACDPADKGPDATPIDFLTPLEGAGISEGSGEFTAVMEYDPGIPTHTVIRPEPLGEIKHPILAWGNGGCRKNANDFTGQNTNLFKEFASHGFLIVADGPAVAGGPTMPGTDARPLLSAIEWAQQENERPCSKYYHKLNVEKVAVSGQSCGGLMAIQAATDPRITTAFPYNSGLFARDQRIYDALHAPMAIFDGGPGDIAYANGLADFNAIDNIPILFANPTSCSTNAHLCTFFDENAGEFGRAGVAWMRWHLLDDQGPTGKGMFIGDNCGMCGPAWDIQWKNAPAP